MDDLEHMEQELEEVKKDYRDGKDLDPELARVCRKTNCVLNGYLIVTTLCHTVQELLLLQVTVGNCYYRCPDFLV